MKNLIFIITITLFYSSSGYSTEPLGTPLKNTTPPPNIDPQLVINNYNKAACCIFIDQLKAIKLEKRKTLELNLHQSSHLLELSTGPTFAELIKIPVSSKKERYVVETNVIHTDKDLYVYFPYIALLNPSLELVGTSDFTHSNYYEQSWFQAAGRLSFDFLIKPNTDLYNSKSVRYLLIYTRKKHFTKKSKEELKANIRNIEAKEVPVEYTGSTGEAIYRDIMHGLPGGRVTISNKNRFF